MDASDENPDVANVAPKRPYKCTFGNCVSVFKCQGSKLRHQREKHGNGRYQCPECGKLFTRLWNSAEHRRTMHNNPRIRHVITLELRQRDISAKSSIADSHSNVGYAVRSEAKPRITLPTIKPLLAYGRGDSSPQPGDHAVNQAPKSLDTPMGETRMPPPFREHHQGHLSTADGNDSSASNGESSTSALMDL